MANSLPRLSRPQRHRAGTLRSAPSGDRWASECQESRIPDTRCVPLRASGVGELKPKPGGGGGGGKLSGATASLRSAKFTPPTKRSAPLMAASFPADTLACATSQRRRLLLHPSRIRPRSRPRRANRRAQKRVRAKFCPLFCPANAHNTSWRISAPNLP